ncbi:MAG: Rpn family recombination-promoting nuclease/putative transposase [Pseudohongiellaceae bacterium]
MVEAKKLDKPHDSLCNELFSNRKLADAFLREHLPRKITALLKKGALPELVGGNFVEPGARRLQADVLCRVPLKSGAADYHYFLIEHKSWPDQDVLVQLSRYQLGIWRRYAEEDESGKQVLPPITPLVVYHGEQPWNVPRSFRETVKNGDKIPYSGLDFSYQLVDLTSIPHEDLSGNRELQAVLGALRGFGRQEEGKAKMVDIIKALSANRGLEEFVFHYIVGTWKLDHVEINQLINATKRGGEIMNSFVATLAKKYLAEGRAEGEAKGEIKTLKHQVQVRFGSVPQDVDVRIDQASPEEIRGWAERILTAASLEEMFASPSNR